MPDQGQAPKRNFKVIRLRILKPAGGGNWAQLGQLLEDVRYRVFRLGNMAAFDKYNSFQRSRQEKANIPPRKISELNKLLWEMLREEHQKPGKSPGKTPLAHLAREGALPSYVVDALSKNKLQAITSGSKWDDVARGKASPPYFKQDMAIPIRCDKPGSRRLERMENGEVELDLMISRKPYPRAVLATAPKSLGDGPREILNRLLEGKDGYKQRSFEIKREKLTGNWWLYAAYEFPKAVSPSLSRERVVGVDLGFACPLYAAISNGHARLGWRKFGGVAHRIRVLQARTIKRRREIQRGGNALIENARSGHGRKRKLLPIEPLEGRIDRAYTTLNHQMSAALIEFARNNGAGIIQMEDLSGLGERLAGSFIGERWRYFQLKDFIKYKGEAEGMEVRFIKPSYTSRRCSKCGWINMEFTSEYRKNNGKDGRGASFVCPREGCGHKSDPDYNAARNLSDIDIENKIEEACRKQGIPLPGRANNEEI